MKAVVFKEFGPPKVLQLEEVPTPVPKDNEVLVRVRATTVNYGDLVARDFPSISPSQFNMPFLFWILTRVSFGLRRPTLWVLGNEFAGEVASVGKDVQRFKEGDLVFGYRGQSMGAYAEYVTMPEDGTIALKPANVSYEEAAVVPSGAMTALHILRAVGVQQGQTILINGASGGIGSRAVQIAKWQMGAKVTGVCSTPRVKMVKALGADKVIDYTLEDFTQSGETYDVIFDILGRSSFSKCKGSLAQDGRYVLASFKVKQLVQMLWTKVASSRKVLCILSPQSPDDLIAVKELMEAGQIKPVIGRRFSLEQTAEAHRYVESGGKTGDVVISVGNGT